jgi:hypothetical protein
MRYLILIAGDENCDDDISAAYVKYTEDLKASGVLLAGEALQPSGKGGARVTVTAGKRRVTDGPFSEAKELVGGYYLIEVRSREEAIEWAARCPAAQHPEYGYAELREVIDFGA